MTSPTLKIYLLSAFAVEIEGEIMPPLSLKPQWLLALLAMRQGQEVSRERLAASLWPDSEKPLFNLRQALSKDLRPQLGITGTLLRATPKTLCLDTSAWVDVAAFDASIKASKAASTDAFSVPALEKAVELYRGPLLEGCQEEWIFGERAMREEAFHHALERLADAAHQDGNQGKAANYLRRLIASDPFRESAHRMLMTTLAASGDMVGVRQVYQDLRQWLRRELHAEPSAETRALYKQLQQPSSQPALAARPSPPAPSRRLPIPLTRLIGRENDIAAVGEQLRQGRLVTLVGSGGVGKTRLALAVTHALAAEFADGVWFVELASLTNPDLVASAVAQALGIKEQPGQTMAETLVNTLSSRSLLLALDNCEHLLEASAALIEHLLRWCEGVRALATSRHALGLAGGELLYPVPSLEVPPPSLGESGPDAEKNAVSRLREYDATHLFMERMAERDTARRLTSAEASAIAEICRQLEGIPLAIEMAAARVRTMSLEQIRASLSDRFGLLGLGIRSSHSRHKTLHALIDWSCRLLNETQRTLLSRLSVFAGGWTQEAADHVCAEEGRSDSSFSGSDVFDLLSSLVDQSLVAYEARAGEGRYRLLETVRQCVLNRLEESGESDAVRQRHRDCFLALVEAANVHLNGKEENAWLQRLDAENENLRAALNGCLEAGETQIAQRFCGALDRFWQIRGYVTEGRMWCARALEAAGGQERTVERAEALRCASHLAGRQGDASLAETLCKESLTIWQERKDERGIALARMSLGTALFGLRRCAEARSLMEESLASFRALGDKPRIIWALHNLGLVGREQGDYQTVSLWLEESLAIRRELGDRRGIANSLYALGENARNQGDYATAQRRCAESLPILRELGDRPGLAAVLNLRGDLFMIQDDYSAATKPYQESLALYRELGFPHNIAWMLRNMGRLVFAECRYDAAHRALSEALATFPPNNELGVALSRIDLGHVVREQGDWQKARELFEQSAAVLETLEGRPCAALLLNSLGIVDMEQGQLHVAQTRFEEALALS